MEENIINDYLGGLDIYSLCSKYHIGKLKAKSILIKNGIEIRKRGGQSKNKPYVLCDWKIEKYPSEDGYKYIAKSKDGKYESGDYMNNGGHLTTYIKNTYGVEIPTLYDRREYYKLTGNYWWEQWFNIIKIETKPTKKCPYCNWETEDIKNKSGVFEQHLLKEHNKTIKEYLNEYPNDLEYFNTYKKELKREESLKNEGDYVICPICGDKFKRIGVEHLSFKHGMTVEGFKKMYPNQKMICDELSKRNAANFKLGNLSTPKRRFISKYEREITNYIKDRGCDVECNHQILIGKELDMVVHDRKVAIEFNGLFWHREGAGKDKNYHLNKTEMCNSKGYGLIHIFEDEYLEHKDIVLNKICHILHIDNNLPRIAGRKILVKEIYSHEAKEFLNKFHIQGFSSSSVYIGGYYNNELVAVMTFKFGNIKNTDWDLTRFATNNKYIYQGVGGKLFSYFIKTYKPNKVVSFADRRWTINEKDNLYTKLGFELVSINKPDYRYFNPKGHDVKRIHKMTFNKKALSKKYGFSLNLTEKEMIKELGYDRIWDCGLFKYVWYNRKIN